MPVPLCVLLAETDGSKREAEAICIEHGCINELIFVTDELVIH